MLETKVYEDVKYIYGPYTGKDSRQRVIIVFNSGKQKTVSFPKFLMQEYLGRFIQEPETIDHIDSNVNNNSIENLRIINRSEHACLDVKRVKEQDFICGVCKKTFTLSGRKLNDAFMNRKKGHKGPFCSRSCAGKASHNIDRYETLEVIREYYTNKSLIKEI